MTVEEENGTVTGGAPAPPPGGAPSVTEEIGPGPESTATPGQKPILGVSEKPNFDLGAVFPGIAPSLSFGGISNFETPQLPTPLIGHTPRMSNPPKTPSQPQKNTEDEIFDGLDTSFAGLSVGSPAPTSNFDYQDEVMYQKIINTLKIHEDSTKHHPIIVKVDEEFPERCTPFLVVKTPEMKCPDHNHHLTWMIDLRVAHGDTNNWGASIPQAVPHPLLKNRTVLVKGVSVDDDGMKFRRYILQNAQEPIDGAVAETHQTTLTAIRTEEGRAVRYYLLVFPLSTVLDNNTFSQESGGVVKRIVSGATIPEAETTFQSGPVRVVSILWQIADAALKKGVNNRKSDVTDLTTLFPRAGAGAGGNPAP